MHRQHGRELALSRRGPLTPRQRTFEGALALIAAVTVAPLWSVRFLPFTDLPEHVAAIATLAHWNDAGWGLGAIYEVIFDRSYYLLYHFVGSLLARLFGDAELGHRVLLTLVGLAYPYSMRFLLRTLGRDERLALLAGIPFWNRALSVGFLPYVSSVPALLAMFALHVRWLQRPTARRTWVLALGSVALFFLHLNAFLLFSLLVVTTTLWRPGTPLPETRTEWFARVRELPRRTLWFLPALGAAAFWTHRGSLARGSKSLDDPGEVAYLPGKLLPREFPIWAHDVWRTHVDEVTGVAFWLVILALALHRTERQRPLEWLRAWTPFLLVLFLFVALPFTVGAGGMLNVRLALFFGLFALLVIDVPAGWRGTVPLAIGMLTTLVVSGNAIYECRKAQAELGDFDRVLGAMEPGRKLLTLNARQSSPVAPFFPWIHAGAYYRARGGKVASVSFSELRHWPIRYRDGAGPPAKDIPFWEFAPCAFRNATDGEYYDYVLVRGPLDPFRDRPPGPVWKPTLQDPHFTLYTKVPGETYAPWTVPDGGPCESRRTLELWQGRARTTVP